MRISLLSATLVLASAAVAQIQLPIPAFNRTYIASATRGFYFQTPVPILITGLRVPDEANAGVQNVEVSLLTGAPPAYPGTASGGQVFYAANVPSSQIIPCSLPFNANDWIGVLGACGTTTLNNSYGAPGPFTSSIAGQPVTLTRFLTQTNINTTGGNQPYSSEAAFEPSRIEVYYTTSGYAYSTPYGPGCYSSHHVFYENFAAGAFDLGSGAAGTTNSVMLVPNGQGGYVLVPGSNTFFTPVAPNLGLTDDSVSAAQTLPFPWSYPGGTTTTLKIGSNGMVFPEAFTSTDYTPSVAELLTQGNRFCMLWRDLNPSAGGSVHFDVDPTNTSVYCTWMAVPSFGSTSTNTMQMMISSTGTIELRYQLCDTGPGAIVGHSEGGNLPDPGSIDISQLATQGYSTGASTRPLTLSASARPLVGANITLDTVNTGNALLGATIVSFTQFNPGLSLTSLGMDGCFQHAGLDVVFAFFPTGGAGSSPFNIPNQPGLANLEVYSQSAAFDSGHNVLGVTSSNGLHLHVDLN